MGILDVVVWRLIFEFVTQVCAFVQMQEALEVLPLEIFGACVC